MYISNRIKLGSPLHLCESAVTRASSFFHFRLRRGMPFSGFVYNFRVRRIMSFPIFRASLMHHTGTRNLRTVHGQACRGKIVVPRASPRRPVAPQWPRALSIFNSSFLRTDGSEPWGIGFVLALPTASSTTRPRQQSRSCALQS